MKLLFFLYLILISSIIPQQLQGQDRYIEIVQKYGKPQFYLETEIFQSSYPDSARVLGSARISYDNSFFTKRSDGKFETEVTFTIEILKDNIGVARKMFKRNAVVSEFEQTKDRKKYLEVSFEIPLKHGTYEMVTEIFDNEIQKQLRTDKRKLTIENHNDKPILASQPMFFYRTALNRDTINLKPLGVGGNGIFGVDYFVAIEAISQTSIDKLQYKLYLKSESGEQLIDEKDLSLKSLIPIKTISPYTKSDTAGFLAITNRDSKSYLAFIDFSAGSLANARYKLVVVLSSFNKTIEVQKDFENAWTNMPYSLYDLDIATRLMEYIIPNQDEFDAFQSGGSDERRKKFDAYWKKNDPTPKTVYNEMMAEYFRRVDYSFFNYFTSREFGWRTDRGKTYILYGEPTKIEREFPKNSQTREVWLYSTIKRKFVFVDKTNTGTYELISVDNI